MHIREDGVVVRWEDLRVDGDKIFGKPVINLSNPRGQQTVDEIENGFLNGASVGKMVVLEYSDDPALKLPGQAGITVTKWYPRECSLVDIPGNLDSLSLFDKDDNPINLSDFSKPKIQSMKQFVLTAAQLAALNLKDDADATAVGTAINDLVARANSAAQLTLENTAIKAAKEKADGDLVALKAQVAKDQVEALISAALADKRITVALGDKLKADYATNPDGLKTIVEALPKFQSVTEQIDKSKQTGAVADLAAKSWDELFTTGKLEELKAKDPETFKTKFKAEFGTDYKE
jgi:hypothetical protein